MYSTGASSLVLKVWESGFILRLFGSLVCLSCGEPRLPFARPVAQSTSQMLARGLLVHINCSVP